MQKNKVIVICGPTSSGKTALSVELAKKINGQIISCDSMQIYKDMSIGTSKVTEEEMQGVKHYLVDFVSPDTRYSVAEFKKDAKVAIREIISNGKVPIVVGGTGLFVDSLIYEIEYKEIKFDEEFRSNLEKRVLDEGLESLYNEAKQIDPDAMEKISINDQKRILRVLEIYKATGKNKTEQEKESRKNEVEYNYLVYALKWEREELYSRINLKVDMMIDQGLVKEVDDLLKKYTEFPTAMQSLGYKEVVEYFDGKMNKDEMIEKIKQETRRYSKRQMTWFRKNKETIWLDAKEELEDNIKVIIEGFEDAK